MSAEAYVVDTHALVWRAVGLRRRFGDRSHDVFERFEGGALTLYVPAMVAEAGAQLARTSRRSLRAEIERAGASPEDVWAVIDAAPQRTVPGEVTAGLASVLDVDTRRGGGGDDATCERGEFHRLRPGRCAGPLTLAECHACGAGERRQIERECDPMDLGERLERRPGVLGGQPVVRGTRVPVRALVASLAGGMTIEQVCDSYRVAVEDVRAALSYAVELLDEDRALGAAPAR